MRERKIKRKWYGRMFDWEKKIWEILVGGIEEKMWEGEGLRWEVTRLPLSSLQLILMFFIFFTNNFFSLINYFFYSEGALEKIYTNYNSRYSRSTVNGTSSSHIHSRIYHKYKRIEYHFTILREYLSIFH